MAQVGQVVGPQLVQVRFGAQVEGGCLEGDVHLQLVATDKVAAFDRHVAGHKGPAAGINGPGHDACLGPQ
nr:hypothetical protein [Planctomycetales bacterium]